MKDRSKRSKDDLRYYLVFLRCSDVIAVSIAEACDYNGGFVVGRIVHDRFDSLSQSSSGHCCEFSRHTGDDNVPDQRHLRSHDFRLPLVWKAHLSKSGKIDGG